ncbi:MAG: polyhydroxyalkanoate biosynthesis repressor PhaR [gamma proteobacterium symbiont of Phacoides pectinatus]
MNGISAVDLGPFAIGPGHPARVVAEVGINHNGDRELALRMLRAAHEAGADIVKFQTHIADAEMLPDRDPAAGAGSHVQGSPYEIMCQCHLDLEDHLALKAEAESLGLLFLTTPFCVEAVDLLEEVGVGAYKVGSGEVTNLPFLDYLAGKGRPVILSTGTGDWAEVERAVEVIRGHGAPLVLLQCTSNYPTRWEEVHLRVMDRMRERFALPVGLSDHCQGNYACFAAVARGASLVEKHFTLSRQLPGVDQSSSIEPEQLRDLVQGVRAIEAALGGREKRLNAEALKVRQGFSESVVTIAPVRAGEPFRERVNIWVKRPGNGIPSHELARVSGKRALCDLPAGRLLSPDEIEGY